jgi:serine/threonine protein kinase
MGDKVVCWDAVSDANHGGQAERPSGVGSACAPESSTQPTVDWPEGTEPTVAVSTRPFGDPIHCADQIDHFAIRDKLGEGGFAVVYLAEQLEPVRRLVALKIVKLGMDTDEILSRFRIERQVQSTLDHPGVARVYEAGVTARGRAYFAMEYVPGDPITRYCDQHRLGIKDRLALFVSVCGAVQHAHQKGVIHRDLKPSNILVTDTSGMPRAKVIDFGGAKLFEQPLADRSPVTRDGEVLGTPEYMSPEQTGLGNLDIDTRTDIYSLGVLLYELLVGVLPVDRSRWRTTGRPGTPRELWSANAARPSARLAGLSATDAAPLAAGRRCDIGSLVRQVRGDLDRIAMKALETDRDQRYASATEFAGDIERYVRNEPILASRPALGYCAMKFAVRNRAALISVGAMLLVAAILIPLNTLHLSRRLREAAAIQTARTLSHSVDEFRTIYTRDVVNRVKDHGIEVTHDYRGRAGSIPLPATMSLELANSIGRRDSGARMHLSSPYPFPWRTETGGLRDQYSIDAWEALNRDPSVPFYRTETIDDEPVLRYAKADLMRASCVDCHNANPDARRHDWKTGDVRGVLEIDVPIDNLPGEDATVLRQTIMVMIALAVVGLVPFVISELRHRRMVRNWVLRSSVAS